MIPPWVNRAERNRRVNQRIRAVKIGQEGIAMANFRKDVGMPWIKRQNRFCRGMEQTRYTLAKLQTCPK